MIVIVTNIFIDNILNVITNNKLISLKACDISLAGDVDRH